MAMNASSKRGAPWEVEPMRGIKRMLTIMTCLFLSFMIFVMSIFLLLFITGDFGSEHSPGEYSVAGVLVLLIALFMWGFRKLKRDLDFSDFIRRCESRTPEGSVYVIAGSRLRSMKGPSRVEFSDKSFTITGPVGPHPWRTFGVALLVMVIIDMIGSAAEIKQAAATSKDQEFAQLRLRMAEAFETAEKNHDDITMLTLRFSKEYVVLAQTLVAWDERKHPLNKGMFERYGRIVGNKEGIQHPLDLFNAQMESDLVMRDVRTTIIAVGDPKDSPKVFERKEWLLLSVAVCCTVGGGLLIIWLLRRRSAAVVKTPVKGMSHE